VGSLSKFEGKNHPMAMISDWKKIESFDCELLEKSSAESFGLQILDVSMWLLRRVFDNNNEPRGNCRTLFECLVKRSMISRFDFETLVRSVEAGSRYVDGLPLTEEELGRGKRILAEFEKARQNRIFHGLEGPIALAEGSNS
jgi:hypothetical protein